MAEQDSRPIGAVEVPQPAAAEERGGFKPIIKVLAVFLVLGGVITWLLTFGQASDALVYSKLVDEVLTKPSDFRGRELRVEGDLKQGSIQFREEPCEYRFTIGQPGKEMPVRFPQCIVPDTFKDGVGLKVTVQGKLTDEGYFLANKVIAKCPSKYEMNEKAKQGVAVPHAMPNRAPAEG
ncbi:MAG TPA: cytochrome c maturation protein CcmE [Polyangiales bacterium]|nr:cytochrome c maturation protein CcmE [Polyangiales bacterium]